MFFLEDSVSGRVFYFCQNWVFHKKVVSNKQVIIVSRFIIMINRTIDIAKNLQTGQHDSELSEDFNASP